jgi:hypothetical protein
VGADCLHSYILFAFGGFYLEGEDAFGAEGRLELLLHQLLLVVEDEVEILKGFLGIGAVDWLRKAMGDLQPFLVLFN